MFSYVIDLVKKMAQNSIIDEVYKELLGELLINHWLKSMINNRLNLLKYKEGTYSQITQTAHPSASPRIWDERGEAVLLLGKAYKLCNNNRLVKHEDIVVAVTTAFVSREDLVRNPAENAFIS